MGRQMWQIPLGTIGGLLLITAASAQSVSSTLRDFGLMGTWAADCNLQPNPNNEYSSYTLGGSGVTLRNDFGPAYDEMLYQVVSAKRAESDKLSLRQVLTTDRRIVLDTVMMKSEARMRLWSSQGVDGSMLVKGGTIPMANGHETRWTTLCQGRWTGEPGAAGDRGTSGRPSSPSR